MRFWRVPILGLLCLLPALSQAAEKLPLGIVKEKPTEGFFVETPQGFMVPYEAQISGTEVKYKMTPIPGGKFKLGSPDGEEGRGDGEGPQVEIVVEPFWMGVYEITWAEYKEFMS